MLGPRFRHYPNTLRLVSVFALVTTLGALSDFALPTAKQAILENFLVMTPWGIWQNIIAQPESPIRHAYYMETARPGFLHHPAMAVVYVFFLVALAVVMAWERRRR